MRSSKGVTLISLIVTIFIISILAFNITANADKYGNQNKKVNFESDMRKIKEEVNQYYARKKSLPIINRYDTQLLKSNIPENEININDNDEYYVIDLEQFSIEINYGKDLEKIKGMSEERKITSEDNLLDVYVINEQSHTIYYPKGIEYNGKINYVIAQNYTKIDDDIIKYLKDNKIYATADMDVEDSLGNRIVIPKGFKIAEDSGLNVTEGIVIEDNDIITGIGNDRGNQYVWIPVGKEIKKVDGTTTDITLGRYKFADGTNDKAEDGTTILEKGTPILKQNAENYLKEVIIDSYYKELSISRPGVASSGLDGENATALDLKAFIDSVKKNGGYYIARYEASYGEDGKANSKVSNDFNNSTTIPTSEGYLWNNITQIDATKASRNLYTTINSDLINSYAWDTAIVYIQAFSGDIDYSMQNSKNTSLSNTGVNGDEVCKINDMASNTVEWTTEYSTNTTSSNAYPCTHRGGHYYNNSYYTNTRLTYFANGSLKYSTFRSALYM